MTSFLKNQTKAFSKLLLILIVVGVIVLAAVGVLSWALLRQPPPARPLGPITNCVGTVLEIGENTVKIKAEKERNPFGEDRYFEITVAKDTKILKQGGGLFDVRTTDQGKILFVPKPGVNLEAQKESQQWKTLNIADLKAGNSIAAQSSVNLRKENSFTAVYIIVIE